MVADWIRAHRRFDSIPPEPEFLDQYITDWLSWWKSLQPAWRAQLPDYDRTVPEDAEWPELMKGGANGFFLIVFTLTWWTVHAVTEEQSEGGKKAFLDVAFVLKQMTIKLARENSVEPSPKR